MNIRPNLRLSILVVALAATTATTWAAYERGNSSLVPAYEAPPPVVANEHGLAPNEQVVTPIAAEAPIAPKETLAPVSEAVSSAPPITVEQQRLTNDERIQADVIELLARNPHLSGKIGVVTQDAVVTLTGYTTTSGQAWRAGRDARGVQGVRHVVNEIRPRVGGITS